MAMRPAAVFPEGRTPESASNRGMRPQTVWHDSIGHNPGHTSHCSIGDSSWFHAVGRIGSCNTQSSQTKESSLNHTSNGDKTCHDSVLEFVLLYELVCRAIEEVVVWF